MQIETKSGGGIGSVLRRTVLGGESLFMNDVEATRDDSRLTLAPVLPGDIIGLELLAGQDLLVQSGSYMASSPEVAIDTSCLKTFVRPLLSSSDGRLQGSA
jgi:uncharacterized protein (AIM24 family)